MSIDNKEESRDRWRRFIKSLEHRNAETAVTMNTVQEQFNQRADRAPRFTTNPTQNNHQIRR